MSRNNKPITMPKSKPARKTRSKAKAGSKARSTSRRTPRAARSKPQREYVSLGWGRWQSVLALLVVCGLLFFVGLGGRSLWESDESRYGEIAREMVTSGDWVTPRLNYVKYFEKPALTYWLTATSFSLFGVSDASARLVPAVFGTLTVLLVYLLGRLLFDERAGFASALILAASLMFWMLSRVVLVDMVMCFGVVLSIYGIWAARLRAAHAVWAFWLGLAVAFMTKGLLGPGLAGMLLVFYLLLSREWFLLPYLLRLRGPILFLLICAPWVIWVSLVNPEFFSFFFIDEHLGRLLTTRHHRYEPFYYFFLVVPAGFYPWIAYLPWALKHNWPGRAWLAEPHRSWLLAALWFVSFFVFFTLSRSKMLHYALPMLPALALIIGRPLSTLALDAKAGPNPAGISRALAVLAGLVLIMALAPLVYPAFSPDVHYAHFGAFLLIGPAVLVVLALGIYALRAKPWAVWAAPLTAMVLAIGAFSVAVPRLEPYRSLKPLVSQIKPRLKDSDVLVTYRDFFNGVAFYTGRRVAVVRNFGELDFGRKLAEDANRWFLPNAAAMFKWLEGNKRIFVFCYKEHYPALQDEAKHKGLPIFQWGEAGDKVVFSNRPRG